MSSEIIPEIIPEQDQSRALYQWILAAQFEQLKKAEDLPVLDIDRRNILIEIRATVALLQSTFPKQPRPRRPNVPKLPAPLELSEESQREMEKVNKKQTERQSNGKSAGNT